MCSLEKIQGIFSDAMREVPKGDIGVAVSGGGDSLALLLLSVDWARENGRCIKSATINHGLRPESQSECEYVNKIATDLLIQHSTLYWSKKFTGNLQMAARNARYDLLKNWAACEKLSVVLLGHNHDDNAETIFGRLSRGSGIDGLTGMTRSQNLNNLEIFRPLLEISRIELRRFLTKKSVNWIDEPSNLDERFQRIKIRKLLPTLSQVGLTPKKLISLAEHMTRAKTALNSEVYSFSENYVKQKKWGDLEIEREAFVNLASEYQFRLISAGLRWVSGSIYRPRLKSVKMLLNLILKNKFVPGVSLMGCIVRCKGERIILTREYSAMKKFHRVLDKSFLWDKKWLLEVEASQVNHTMVGPLGKIGLSKIEIVNRLGIPTEALISTVALFNENEILCVPLLSYGLGLKMKIVGGSGAFLNFLSAY